MSRKFMVAALGSTFLCALLVPVSPARAQPPTTAERVLPRPPAPFTGTIGTTYADSRGAVSTPVTAPKGAPNVLLVLTDDVGFGLSSTFGGPVPTPNLDRLAANGLRYNRFHTTAMCSPTRAALLTGRNHHAVGSGIVTDLAAGYPGYSGVMPKSAATIAKVLTLSGYNTAMFGKHHNVQPGAVSAAGPFDQWPTGLGFEYFYGFVGAETNQFHPALYRGITPVKAPEGEMLDEILVDDAILWVHNQQAAAPDKPFFLYLATGSAHAPQQAPKAWIEKFRGQFDQGWDRMNGETLARQKALGVVPADTIATPRPETIPAWDTISDGRKKTNARMMEVVAGMLAHQDYQFGRLIDELERTGELENTLVLFIQGDNGAPAEGGLHGNTNPLGGFNGFLETEAQMVAKIDELGGPNTNQNFGAGWSWAMNTPFRWQKQVGSHLGGTRNGLVVAWPAGIQGRGVRPQFHHVIDIAPTILDAAGLPAPAVVEGAEQQRMDGVSIAYSFNAPQAAGTRGTQYFEMMGNRAIYHDGWIASTTPVRAENWVQRPPPAHVTPDAYQWELSNIDDDFSQSRDLAARNPGKLAEMKALFDQEAKRNGVYPLDDRLDMQRFAAAHALGPKPRASYVYWGKDITVPGDMGPSFTGSFSLTAAIETEAGATDGVLAALGGKFAGWSFYLKDGRPMVTMAGANTPERVFQVGGNQRVSSGPSLVRYDFEADGLGGGGLMRISIDGREVGQGRIEQTILRTTEMTDTLDVGFDGHTPVTGDYANEGRFAGEIRKLTIEVAPVAGVTPGRD